MLHGETSGADRKQPHLQLYDDDSENEQGVETASLLSSHQRQPSSDVISSSSVASPRSLPVSPPSGSLSLKLVKVMRTLSLLLALLSAGAAANAAAAAFSASTIVLINVAAPILAVAALAVGALALLPFRAVGLLSQPHHQSQPADVSPSNSAREHHRQLRAKREYAAELFGFFWNAGLTVGLSILALSCGLLFSCDQLSNYVHLHWTDRDFQHSSWFTGLDRAAGAWRVKSSAALIGCSSLFIVFILAILLFGSAYVRAAALVDVQSFLWSDLVVGICGAISIGTSIYMSYHRDSLILSTGEIEAARWIGILLVVLAVVGLVRVFLWERLSAFDWSDSIFAPAVNPFTGRRRRWPIVLHVASLALAAVALLLGGALLFDRSAHVDSWLTAQLSQQQQILYLSTDNESDAAKLHLATSLKTSFLGVCASIMAVHVAIGAAFAARLESVLDALSADGKSELSQQRRRVINSIF